MFLQNVTGSAGKVSSKKLTPFEQAEYNLVKFALNAQLSQDIYDLVIQLEALEKLKKKYSLAVESLEGDEESLIRIRAKRRLLAVEDELTAVEYLLQTVCGSADEEM